MQQQEQQRLQKMMQLKQQQEQQKQQKQKQEQERLEQEKHQHQLYRQQQAQQLFDYMYMQQLQQQESVRRQQEQQKKQAALKAASLEKVRVAEANRQAALKAVEEADAIRQAALEEIAEQERLEREAEKQRREDAEKQAAEKAKAEKQAALKRAEAEKAKIDAEKKAAAEKKAQLEAQKVKSHSTQPKPVQSEAEAFADYYSQLTGCPGNGPSFAQALKQLGLNVHYQSDEEDEDEEDNETLADSNEQQMVSEKELPLQVDLSQPEPKSDVEDDSADLREPSEEIHPLVAFLQSLGIPATISEPQVAKAESQEDPDLALADFVESLSDDERPSEASKKASKAAKRAAKAHEAAAKAQAEAEAAAKAQIEAEEELKREKLERKAAKKAAAKAAKKAKQAKQSQAPSTPSTPSKPLPSVVVYSSPVDTEKDVSKQLAKLASVVDRSVETYERIKKAATQSDSEYSNSVSSYNSRIKVIQQAQIKLEQIYDQLDSMTVNNDSDEKKERTRLIRKAVSTAEAIDSVVEQLKSEKAKIEKSVSSSDEEEIPRKVTNKTNKYSSNKKNSKTVSNAGSGSPVRKVTLETVPDADSASDY